MKFYVLHLDKPNLTIEEEKQKKYYFMLENEYVCYSKKEMKKIIECFKGEMEDYAKDHNLVCEKSYGDNVQYVLYYPKGTNVGEVYAETWFETMTADDLEEIEEYKENYDIGEFDL